jgi:zinc protease
MKDDRMKKWMGMALLCCMTTAHAEVQEYQLDNGLHILVQEDHRSAVVVSQLWYRVGSMDEVNGYTGLAHMLEHMMFKGTADVPDGQFSKMIAAVGGRENAFTNQDYTVYFEQLQKNQLPLAFKLEADRMHNLSLTEEGFRKENQVVREERRMRTEDQPQALVEEQMMATTFEANPARRPVIGWMNDIENLTLGDVRTWYHNWYAPNNATLVVVGDVDGKQVRDLAQQYFGGIPAITLPVRKPQIEPPQIGIKRIEVKAPAKVPYMMMAWHVPFLHHHHDDQAYALLVLAGVLDGNSGARLGKEVVRGQRIATEASASYDLLGRGPGLFVMDGTPTQGKTIAELETALRAQVQKIIEQGIGADELKRVKAQVIANSVYQRDSIFYQGMLLGQYVSEGLPASAVADEVARVDAVTAAQVQAVARQYLVDDGLTVATLAPQPWDDRKARPAVDSHDLR